MHKKWLFHQEQPFFCLEAKADLRQNFYLYELKKIDMDIESFREWCLTFPGTTEGIKWEDHLCFMVAEKIFVLMDIQAPHSFALKVDPNDFDQLVSRDGIKQAYHMARGQWVGIDSLQVLDRDELQKMVGQSRSLVLSKLPKKIQAKYQL